MKKALVIYYTQTGQLLRILQSLVSGFSENIECKFLEIKPKNPIPFPWKGYDFFDHMPESVLLTPIEVTFDEITEDFDFIIPVGTTGDCYDRFLVRNEEMWQSLSIIEQAYQKVQEFKGAEAEVFHADTPAYYLPEKKDVYTKMEALIYHFKIVMGETAIPEGEVYSAVEGANGELGFYLISDGGRTPYRLHFRRPCFIYYQAFEELVKGGMLSDAVITMSSLNLIAGEMDA